MAEIEEKERTTKDWAKILAPRILRAVIWGFLMGGEMLLLLNIFGQWEQQIGMPLPEPESFSNFFLVFIGFEVAIQLLRGTIFPYILATARALVSMVILVTITDGGVISMPLSSSPQIPIPLDMGITFTIEFQAIIGAALLLSSLGIVKNMLQAVQFMSEKEEDPELP